MDKPDLSLDFQSPEDLRLICRHLAARLHYLNRVAGGEAAFNAAVADLLEKTGRLFAEKYKDKDMRALFGDGWTEGAIDRDARPAALMALMYPPKNEG